MNNKTDYAKTTYVKEELEAALWAWETFGGIGARTRRGFGAITLKSIDQKKVEFPSNTNIEDFIKSGLRKHVITSASWPTDVPHLSHNLTFKAISKADFNNANSAWNYLINRLKNFRQERNPGTQPNRPGRSKWPEPEAIRHLTSQRLPKHSQLASLKDINKFPRAYFGLPIIFQFNPKDYNPNNPYDSNSDPRKTMLTLAESDRLASPLILRPLACKNNKFVALAILLEGTQRLLNAQQVTLKTNESTGTPTQRSQEWANCVVKLNPSEAKKIVTSSGKPLLGTETDILKAFLNFLN